MKTDDYKQELHISATLHSTNAKKIFLRSKKPRIAAKVFYDFFSELLGRSQKYWCAELRQKKRPLTQGAAWIHDENIF
jgi:hypothetical protein